jgi:hypothetical protein
MTNLETILLEYFMTARSTLDADYAWDIPEMLPIPFTRDTDSRARANIRLRRELRNVWMNEPARRYELAAWYVRDWGGIRRNDDATIKVYCDSPEGELASSTWKGVATWSKILAMRNPDKYAIYDARVGAALVALQLLKGAPNLLLFPQVPSRNNAITDFQRRIKTIGGRRGQTYNDYADLLGTVAAKTKLNSPEEIGMVLFANSLSLVTKVRHLLEQSTLI